MSRLLVLATATAALAIGCGGGAKTAPAPAPAPTVQNTAEPGAVPPAVATDDEIDAVVRESIAMSTRLGEATTGKDCAGIAAAIDAETERSTAFLARLARINTGASAERARARVKEMGYEAKLTEATTAFMNATMPCVDDPAVRAAMDRMMRAMGGPYSERK